MRFLLLLLASFLTIPAFSQDQEKEKEWDVNTPPGNYSSLEFITREGTWMNLDVSPDGKQIVFDMLGDIYIMPVSGGKAEFLRRGLAWEVQPRFSPDGKMISFTSDAGGGDNIWVMKADGSDARQVTKEDFRLLNNAVWTPDGQYLIARKHFTSTRSAGAGELWMYHLSGGSGIQLTKKKNDQQDTNEPSVSPDGRYVYFAEDMYPGGFFKYNKDPNKQIYIIRRYDREKGITENIISGPGGAFRPQVSPDGKKIAFVRRVREKTVLYLYDLASGEEWPVFDKLSKDQQEAWAIFGVYTNFNWMPDNRNLIIWGQGKIWKVDTDIPRGDEIPFTATVKTKIADALNFKQEVAPATFTVKTVRQTITSPDEKWLVFQALGHLWKKKLPGGKPDRLTHSNDLEFEPSFSPDGKHLVYVTWNDENSGAIMKLDWKSPGATPEKITTSKGIYRTPSYSSDGSRITYHKEGGNDHQGFAYCTEPGIYWMLANGEEATRVSENGMFPVFNWDGTKIMFQTGGYLFGALDKKLKSVDLEGDKVQEIVKSKYANRFVPSPDGKWIAFNELFKVYIAPMPQTGKVIDLDAKMKAIPVSQVAEDAGISLHWAADSDKLHWNLGEEYFTVELKDHFTFLEGAPDKPADPEISGEKIGLEVKTDKPLGTMALKGARIITMRGDQVIENGTIVIEENKIIAVGESDKVKIPDGAKVINVKGKTIMPGIIDVHAHLGTFRYGLSPQKQWSYYANLAYGVTTTHDPSSNTEMVFSQSEMVKSGVMFGPRIYSTGIILYGADGDFKAVINSLEDALSHLRRTQAWGAFSVKSYNQPRRDQRQQVIQAARQLNMMVYPEGGSHFFHNLSMVADGHTGIEHNIPVAPVYNDVLKFWGKSKTGYTPTLIVCYGAVQGENYWYQNTNVWEDEKLLKYTPRSLIDSRCRHRTMIPQEEYENGHIMVSKACKQLADEGVKVNLGAHGQLQGLGAHWELWMLAQGGMSNHEALRAATVNGAEYIGMGDEIGAIRAGMLADLIVLDKNPLEDIQNSNTVRYTIINGRMFETSTMNEVGNYEVERSKFWWEHEKNNTSFPWHKETNSFGGHGCHCGR